MLTFQPSSLARFAFTHLLLFAVGMALVLHYGPIGFLPSNQSIVFDGGWRILCGQVPYLDFVSPNALVPSVMQAGFFFFFGVTWASYVLHAAVMNGLFSIVVFWFLRSFDLRAPWAFFYALLTAIFFYTPSGVPYMEQHSFFFSILGLTCLFWFERVKHRAFLPLLAAIPPAYVLAYLSKQIPSTLFAAFVTLYLFFNRRAYSKNNLLTLFASGIISLAATALIFWMWGSRWDLIKLYFFDLPGSLGSERILHILDHKQVIAFFNILGSRYFIVFFLAFSGIMAWYLWSRSKKIRVTPSDLPILILPIVIACGVSLISLFVWRVFSIVILQGILCYLLVSGKTRPLSYPVRKTLWVSEAIIVIGLVFIALTNMIAANGLPWLMLAIGLTHAALLKSSITTDRLNIIIGVLVLVALFDTVCFDLRINRTRAALFLTPEQLKQPSITGIPGPLEAMKGPLYQGYSFTARDLSVLAVYLKQEPGNFWYFGDASVVYGAAGKPSINPALWYHFGLTLPRPGTEEFDAYQDRLLSTFERFDVRQIVLEDTVTKSGCSLSSFSKIEQFIAANALDTILVAGFPVIRLRADYSIMP